MTVTREAVLEALKTVTDPFSKKDLVSADLVRALTIEGDAVRFVMEVEGSRGSAMEPVRLSAQEVVEAVPGVAKVSALLTAHSQQKPPPDLQVGRHPQKQAGPEKIAGIDRIIAVASGIAARTASASKLDWKIIAPPAISVMLVATNSPWV